MVTVLFTCHACGLTKAKCFVRDRGKSEDVLEFMKEVQTQVGITHSLLSRECKERKADLYIPYDENNIGSSDK